MSTPPVSSFLVIEDSYADFLLLERELRRQGIRARLHRVDTLPDLRAALTGQHWDLVMADYHVPGLPFSRALATVLDLHPDCPVVIVSGEIGEEVAVEQLKLGAADFVLKDRPARLGQVVRRALQDALTQQGSRRAQQLLQQSMDELRRAAVVFEHVREGVLIVDPDGILVSTNPAFRRMSGMDDAARPGLRLSDLACQPAPQELLSRIWDTMCVKADWQGEISHQARPADATQTLWLSLSTLCDADGMLLNHIALLTDISQLRRSEQKLQHLASHDPLTDLPNRMQMMERLQHAMRRARRLRHGGAVLCLDLDRFKDINDSHGHPVGDALLKLVAQRLRENLRDSDTLARLGGDEFVVMLEDLPEISHAARVAQHLIDQISRAFVVGTHELFVGLSIGISGFPEGSANADIVIQHADTALYQAKARGGNLGGNFCFYTREQTEAVSERQALDGKLRRAMMRGEFELHYQPLVNMRTGRADGAEALVRWRDPEQGLVPPDRFIPMTEESGLIIPLGEWILRNACEQLVAWLAQGIDLKSLSINLSRRQFGQDDLASRILSILHETGAPADRVVLELTETVLMERHEEAVSKMNELCAAGVRIAIDDFGVGWSSFDHLRRLPISSLKIDRSFLREVPADKRDSNLVAAIISMGRTLGLAVVAEGVEQAGQLAFLRQQGCDHAQGYLLARPVPAADLPMALLAASATPSTPPPVTPPWPEKSAHL